MLHYFRAEVGEPKIKIRIKKVEHVFKQINLFFLCLRLKKIYYYNNFIYGGTKFNIIL